MSKNTFPAWRNKRTTKTNGKILRRQNLNDYDTVQLLLCCSKMKRNEIKPCAACGRMKTVQNSEQNMKRGTAVLRFTVGKNDKKKHRRWWGGGGRARRIISETAGQTCTLLCGPLSTVVQWRPAPLAKHYSPVLQLKLHRDPVQRRYFI